MIFLLNTIIKIHPRYVGIKRNNNEIQYMKKTTTPLNVFKNESKNTKQEAEATHDYPTRDNLISSILSYAQATQVVKIMKMDVVLYWN